MFLVMKNVYIVNVQIKHNLILNLNEKAKIASLTIIKIYRNSMYGIYKNKYLLLYGKDNTVSAFM